MFHEIPLSSSEETIDICRESTVDRREIEHRDQVLRTYFKGRDWDQNGEYQLKRQLVLNSDGLLPHYPYVIEDEWEVEAGRADKGRGDLVFTDGAGCFAVVEVKWIDLDGSQRTGSTKRVSNRKKRRTVEQQAIDYANNYLELLLKKRKAVESVEGYIFTNEEERPRSLTKVELQQVSC